MRHSLGGKDLLVGTEGVFLNLRKFEKRQLRPTNNSWLVKPVVVGMMKTMSFHRHFLEQVTCFFGKDASKTSLTHFHSQQQLAKNPVTAPFNT